MGWFRPYVRNNFFSSQECNKFNGLCKQIFLCSPKSYLMSFLLAPYSETHINECFCHLWFLTSWLNWHIWQANYGVKNIQVFTFGQPRIGNPAFAAYYSENVPLTIRVTHSHDVVPHLPPYYLIMGEKTYRHFATEVVCCTMSFAYPYEGLALNVCHVPLSTLPASSFGFLIFLSPSFLSLFLGSYFLHQLFAILLLFYACWASEHHVRVFTF